MKVIAGFLWVFENGRGKKSGTDEKKPPVSGGFAENCVSWGYAKSLPPKRVRSK
jgi:hypothetical protein